MLVYGKNVIKELLMQKHKIKKIYISDNFSDKDLLNKLQGININIEYLDKNKLDNMCASTKTQGIAAEIKDYKYVSLDSIINDEASKIIVILDSLEDPHNFGAIIRTCECASVDYIIIPKNKSVKVNATVFKTSSGALSNVKICEVANLANTIKKLKDIGYWIYGSDAKGKNYKEIDYPDKVCLVIGSEGKGLKNIVFKSCDEIISLPMKGNINSLNASVAAGILIYEITNR